MGRTFLAFLKVLQHFFPVSTSNFIFAIHSFMRAVVVVGSTSFTERFILFPIVNETVITFKPFTMKILRASFALLFVCFCEVARIFYPLEWHEHILICQLRQGYLFDDCCFIISTCRCWWLCFPGAEKKDVSLSCPGLVAASESAFEAAFLFCSVLGITL